MNSCPPENVKMRYRCTSILNLFLLMIPVYVVYDGIVNTRAEVYQSHTERQIFNKTKTTSLYSDVIINTYMRSGSSFLGKMLGFRKDTFYVYEPLWLFHKYGYYNGTSEVCWTFTLGCSKNTDVDKALNYMRSLYDCQLVKNRMSIKENIQPKLSGPSWDIYHRCRRNKAVENMTSCLRNEIAVCKNAKHRVTKVLRMSLDLMEIFLNESSNMKVVHLFRDPRAILNSHFQTSWSPLRRGNAEQITKAARALCNRILRDIDAGIQLQKAFPTRFKIIQYEDFDDPWSKITKLYKFLGMTQTKETQRFIVQPGASGSGGSSRGNHPFKYRTMMKWPTIKGIDQACGEVYDKLGYARYQNERSYMDVNISGIQQDIPYRL